jgi:RNA polymerase sigma-70 factor (sigma-E family)
VGEAENADSVDVVRLDVAESFDAFFVRNYAGLVRLSVGLVGDRSAAEDVVQDAFYAAHQDWDRIGTLDSPLGWVRRIVANRSVSFLRRRAAEARALARLGSRQQAAVEMPADAIDFWRLVRRLPARQAQVVALHYAADMSLAEIGQMFGISEGSVKASLSKARASLARKLGAPGALTDTSRSGI